MYGIGIPELIVLAVLMAIAALPVWLIMRWVNKREGRPGKRPAPPPHGH